VITALPDCRRSLVEEEGREQYCCRVGRKQRVSKSRVIAVWCCFFINKYKGDI
jgi:hypothetical protein